VYYGRMPHKHWFEGKNREDAEMVGWALRQVGLEAFRKKPISALSGGERQRAFIAQALCQRPDVLLLDEPTTYLDISYQLEVMELIRELNEKLGLTVVMVLHELNQAIKYSDELVVMKSGRIVTMGAPHEIICPLLIQDVYGIKSRIETDLETRMPYIVPLQSLRCI